MILMFREILNIYNYLNFDINIEKIKLKGILKESSTQSNPNFIHRNLHYLSNLSPIPINPNLTHLNLKK